MSLLLKGIQIGLLFGVPAGAVGAMTVQRTLQAGPRAGLLTGLGSSVADCFYACVGVFGLTLVSDFLLKGQNMIHMAGGCLIFGMGVGLLCRKDASVQSRMMGIQRILVFLLENGKISSEKVFVYSFHHLLWELPIRR